jgi:hypothetical protein
VEARDELFAIEHELPRRSFFCPGSPPEWFSRESVSPPCSDDPDMARRRRTSMCGARRRSSLQARAAPGQRLPATLPRLTIINGDALIFID